MTRGAEGSMGAGFLKWDMRNATPQDLTYTRGDLYERRKKSWGGDRKSEDAGSSGQNAHLTDEKTADEVAAGSGVGENTVRRDAEYSRAVDVLTEAFGENFKAHVLSGESKLSKADVAKN